MNDSICLVARPVKQINSPVAIGSSVPAWPIFRMRVSPRSLRITSKDDQPFGLSMSRTAALKSAGTRPFSQTSTPDAPSTESTDLLQSSDYLACCRMRLGIRGSLCPLFTNLIK